MIQQVLDGWFGFVQMTDLAPLASAKRIVGAV